MSVVLDSLHRLRSLAPKVTKEVTPPSMFDIPALHAVVLVLNVKALAYMEVILLLYLHFLVHRTWKRLLEASAGGGGGTGPNRGAPAPGAMWFWRWRTW